MFDTVNLTNWKTLLRHADIQSSLNQTKKQKQKKTIKVVPFLHAL